MTNYDDLKNDLMIAAVKAVRQKRKEIYKRGEESHADELRDAIMSSDEVWEVAMEIAKHEKKHGGTDIFEEANQEHQSKTEDSMRKRHVPEWRIDKPTLNEV